MGVLTTTGLFAGLQLSSAAAVAAGAVGAVGAIQSGNAAASAGKVQAELYERSAKREREIGALNAKRVRAKTESTAASARAMLAGSGTDASTGSALLIQEDIAAEGEFNARLAENNAEVSATGQTTQAVLSRAEGRNARTASYYRAGTSLLSGASSFG